MKVLFIHHGRVPGGAPTSLSSTINALQEEMPEMDATVWCVNEQMAEFFSDKCAVPCEIVPYPLMEMGKIIIGWTPILQKAGMIKVPEFR
jgi:hypothetical protein